MARISFALRMIKARMDPGAKVCPYCKSRFYQRLQRKWMIISAHKCIYCGLIYRFPTDVGYDTTRFYMTQYEGQQATDIPDEATISHYKSTLFARTAYDKSERIEFLRLTGISKGKLLDYGCSWGYGTFQYASAGFEAKGFELDTNRGEVGSKHLDVEIVNQWNSLRDAGGFDIILSDHSLEHTPRPGEVLDNFYHHSKKEAKLVIFVPNCACEPARTLGVGWGPYMGESHTVAFTPEWFIRNLPRHGFDPKLYDYSGNRLRADDYLSDLGEIILVADKTT